MLKGKADDDYKKRKKGNTDDIPSTRDVISVPLFLFLKISILFDYYSFSVPPFSPSHFLIFPPSHFLTFPFLIFPPSHLSPSHFLNSQSSAPFFQIGDNSIEYRTQKIEY